MDENALSIGIAGIEAELRVLQQALGAGRRSAGISSQARPFADLCGIWKGKIDLSLQEILEAKYRIKPFPDK